MFTDEKALASWKKLLKKYPEKTIEELIPLYAISIIHDYGWPCKPKSTAKEQPPRRESFIGYYEDTGWSTDYWQDTFVPLPEEIPSFWLPISVLPVPYSS